MENKIIKDEIQKENKIIRVIKDEMQIQYMA